MPLGKTTSSIAPSPHDPSPDSPEGYTTVNIGATHVFKLPDGTDLKFRFDVVNVADLHYEIRDGSGIGVFAPQYLPRRGVYGGVSKTF